MVEGKDKYSAKFSPHTCNGGRGEDTRSYLGKQGNFKVKEAGFLDKEQEGCGESSQMFDIETKRRKIAERRGTTLGEFF